MTGTRGVVKCDGREGYSISQVCFDVIAVTRRRRNVFETLIALAARLVTQGGQLSQLTQRATAR